MTDLDKLHADAAVMVVALDKMARIPELPLPLAEFHKYLASLFRALLEGIAAMRRERDEARDELATQNGGNTAALLAALAERDALQRELDAALPDARRYRWLRQGALTERTENSQPIVMQRWHTGSITYTYGEVLDAAIDAAINQETTKC